MSCNDRYSPVPDPDACHCRQPSQRTLEPRYRRANSHACSAKQLGDYPIRSKRVTNHTPTIVLGSRRQYETRSHGFRIDSIAHLGNLIARRNQNCLHLLPTTVPTLVQTAREDAETSGLRRHSERIPDAVHIDQDVFIASQHCVLPHRPGIVRNGTDCFQYRIRASTPQAYPKVTLTSEHFQCPQQTQEATFGNVGVRDAIGSSPPQV